MFPVLHFDVANAEALEPLGKKRKYWFTDAQNRQVLFKVEERGTGEDWAEVITANLCSLLGLPHVAYTLAQAKIGTTVWPGVVCANMAPPPSSLVLGNELLFKRDPAYPDKQRYKVQQHSVGAVCDVLATLGAPAPEWMPIAPAYVHSALDVFIGYLMLDTWVANQDRHHENWGSITQDFSRLAPTFDHAAGLARNVADDEREDRLNTTNPQRSISTFAGRARSMIYGDPSDSRPLSTLEAFSRFADRSSSAAKSWLNKLSDIDSTAILGILNEIPPTRMTDLARKFTHELLLVNQQRLNELQFS
ncbi:MAG: phosphatidylinositol kinase [Gemmataceae bacterium]